MDSRFESAVESICNLAYVLAIEADNPAKVREYVDLLQQSLDLLVSLTKEARLREKP